ncbi:MAG: hypothetical protein LBD86_00745 [Spirochaetaceae bacterium]|nr:hypothetical protein [Spirochaetaceae bacterium]
MKTYKRLILVGSTGRNSGKTFLASELIRRFKGTPVTALKVTGIEERDGPCPRGGQGCGACTINGDFCIDEEFSVGGAKDTSLLLAAGAKRVFWLRCLRKALSRGFAAFLDRSGAAGPIICESNSLREVLKPAFFIMVCDSRGKGVKPSAQKVAEKADFTLQSPISTDDIEELLKALSKKGFSFTEK